MTLSDAFARHWLIMVLPVMLLIGAAVALGLSRAPTYTAHTRLVVGGTNVNRANVLASGGPAESLTTVFSQAVDARGVVDPVSRQLRMSRGEVAERLSGSPIPKSTLVMVTAEGKSAGQAVRLANAASASLIAYATALNRANSDRLASQLKKASLDLTAAKREQRRRTSKGSDGSGKLDAANAGVQEAELRLRSLKVAYRNDQSSTSGQSVLQAFDSAVRASSDRRSKLQLLLVAAIIAGILIGVALGLFRANRGARTVPGG